MRDLERLLRDNDVEVRREALGRLRGRPGETSVKLLVDAMEDPSWRIRNTALQILVEEHPVEEYISRLIGLLYRDDNAGARNTAIEALSRLNEKVTPYLIEAFNTPNRDVRKFIIDVLGGFKDSRSLPLMMNALKDDDENVRATAIERLGKSAESSVVDALIGIIGSEDIWTAYPAADALGRIGDKRAVPALVKALERKTLRAAAIKSLGIIGHPDSLRHVIPFLKDRSKVVQEETIRSIELFYRKRIDEESITGEIKRLIGESAFDILVTHAWSDKPDVRSAAILILGLMKDERAYIPLLEMSQEPGLAEDVKRAFAFIGRDKPETLVTLIGTDSLYQKRFVCEVAATISSPLFYSVFEKLLKDEDGHVRSISAAGLAKIGDPQAIDRLKPLLSDPYEDVQEASVEALAELGQSLHVDEFISMLRDEDPLRRKNAALLLGKIGAKEAAPALGFSLKDGDVSVRKACVQAFSLLKTEDSVEFLILALTDEDPDIRVSAALSLGRIGGERVFGALSLVLSDSDDSVRGAVAKAFGILRDKRAVGPLIGLLSDKNGLVVTASIESLGKIEVEEARSSLLNILSSPDREIRRTAIKALSSFEDIEDALIPYLRDDDWATRMAVVEVLGKRAKAAIRNELEKLLDTEGDPIVLKAVEDSLKRGS